MGTIVTSLKWVANYLERRFPPKFVPADFVLRAEYKAAVDVYSSCLERNTIEIERLKDQIQTLNLRVGLSRPIQTVLKGVR